MELLRVYSYRPSYNKFSKLTNQYSGSFGAVKKSFINIHPYSNIYIGVVTDKTIMRQLTQLIEINTFVIMAYYFVQTVL
jgi:hypothetical protein